MREKNFQGTKIKINYAEGPKNGPVIFLLHALGASWKSWTPILKSLSRDFHVFAFDFRGHGDSDHIKDKYTWENYSTEISEFIEHNSFPSVNIIGHSLGGVVGSIIVTKTKSVKTLCMEDPPLFFNKSFIPYNLLRVFEENFRLAKKKLGIEDTARELRTSFPEINETVAISRAKNIISADPTIWETIIKGDIRAHTNSDEILKNIDVPVLIFRANPEIGGVIHNRNINRLNNLKRFEIEYWEDSPHNMHSSFPCRFIKRYNTFVTSFVKK